MSFDYIRQYYSVPARRGGHITFQGVSCVILAARGKYLKVQRHADAKVMLIHPTWEVVYLNEPEDQS